MADSTRQDIIDAIDTLMKTIKTTAGYKTNGGNNVFDWLDRDLADSELDAIIYRDRNNQIAQETFDKVTNNLDLEIEVKTKNTTDTAKRVRELIEDVYKAIGTDETFGGLALETIPVSEEMDVRQSDEITGSARLVIRITYQSNKWSY